MAENRVEYFTGEPVAVPCAGERSSRVCTTDD